MDQILIRINNKLKKGGVGLKIVLILEGGTPQIIEILEGMVGPKAGRGYPPLSFKWNSPNVFITYKTFLRDV